MYTRVWNKFLPAVRIILKRSVAADQVMQLDKLDFSKAGGGKKAGFSFVVTFRNGKVQGRPASAIATDMITVLQADDKTMDILRGNEFEFEFTPKCELSIRNVGIKPATGTGEMADAAE